MRVALLLISLMLLTMAAPLGGMPPAHAASSTIIGTLPYTITSPGVYILASDLSGTDGITVDADNVVILGNGHRITSTGGGGTGISINSHTNITIANITIDGFGTGIDVTEVDVYNWTGIVIKNVSVLNPVTGIYFDTLEYSAYLENIYVEGTSRTEVAMDLEDTTGVNMVNITLKAVESADTGLYVYSYEDEGTGLYAYGLRVIGPWNSGIYLDDTYSVAISNSVINGSNKGIYLYDAEYTTIIRTVVSNSSEKGIYLDDAYYASILGCSITDSGSYGIYLVDGSEDVVVTGNVVADNGNNGIYAEDFSNINITSNQILRNNGYGVYLASGGSDAYVNGNVFGDNTQSPQAYDEDGVGNWTGNYWSDWSGSGPYTLAGAGSSDGSPLENPAPDLRVTGIYAPSTVTADSLVPVQVEVSNLGYGNASSAPLTLYWSEPPVFTQTEFTWYSPDPSGAAEASYEGVYEDFGNYTISGDDEYFIYKLPFPVEICGQKYNYISVTTNGYIELLNTTQSNIEYEYTVHSNGYHLSVYESEDIDTFPMGSTVIFAISGDLAAPNDTDVPGSFVGVFNLGGTIVVWFNGTTYSDWNSSYPVEYQVILSHNGGITISIKNFKFTNLDGDGFTGIYLAPLGLQIAAGYMLSENTSWTINTMLHEADTKNIDLGAGETANFTLTWNTGMLPHLSPYTLWASSSESADTSIYDTPLLPPTVVEVTPSRPVGGVLVGRGRASSTILLAAVGTVAILLIAFLAFRRSGKY